VIKLFHVEHFHLGIRRSVAKTGITGRQLTGESAQSTLFRVKHPDRHLTRPSPPPDAYLVETLDSQNVPRGTFSTRCSREILQIARYLLQRRHGPPGVQAQVEFRN
jgi:hypothetical protein